LQSEEERLRGPRRAFSAVLACLLTE